MSGTTTQKIKAYNITDSGEALLALMQWYGQISLEKISEQQALAFLDLLERDVIRISNNSDDCYVQRGKNWFTNADKMCRNLQDSL